ATEVCTDRSPASPKPSGEPSKPVPPKSSSVPKAGKTDAGKRTPAAAPTGTAAAIAAAKPGAASSQAATDRSGAGGGSNGGGRTGGPGGSDGGNGKPGGERPERVVIRERRGSGFFGTLTHLAAAVIGGVIVLYGADMIRDFGQRAGVPVPAVTASVPKIFADRVAQLEAAVKAQPASAVPEALATKVTELEAKFERIAGLQDEVAALKTAQAELSKSSAGRASDVGNGDKAAAVSERLSSVEQTLATLSKAAGAENGQPSAGRIAQLAALSGKLTDLESTLKTQLESLRRGILSEVDRRITPAATASEAARTGTERVDRELAELKTEAARLAQRAQTLKANQDRLDNAIRAATEEASRLSSAMDGLKGDVDQKITKLAKPEDVTNAVQPLSSKVAELESGLNTVVENEASRKASAERIVLALRLSNLKRALDRGGAYADELGAVTAVARDSIDVSALEPFKDKGVPTVSTLLSNLQELSFPMIQAADQPKDGSWVDKLVSGAKSIVQVRRTGTTADVDPSSTEGIVARVEQELRSGRVAAALKTAQALADPAKAVAIDWLTQLEARGAVDAAIAKIETTLQDALTSQPASANKG
ncbi:MAG: hypothetical protein AAF732_21765, partial [Pseudomonadota bacterium]